MNIIRFYNQNRKQIFILILIIASIIFGIQLLNYLVIKNNEKEFSSGLSSSTIGATTYNPQQSAISSSNVSNEVYKVHSELINNFIKYCNEGNSESAYELLSLDCKNALFPTLEYFTNNYVKVIFNENKICSIKNWTGNIYKISITENILATGKSNNGVAIEDYFTIVSENGTNKLNINGFIQRTNLNKKSSSNNIEIEVVYKDTYMDYEIYTLKASNKTDKTILLDSGESTQNMYVLDNKNAKYASYINEIGNANLKISPYSGRELKIKYASTYVSTKTIKSLVFKDVIKDFDTYNSYSLKSEYTDRIQVKIEI